MKPKVIFFGSGPVAAESLRLLTDNFEIEAVVTKPRAAHHKGSVPVLELANDLSLKTHTVTSKDSLDRLIETKPFMSRLAILIDFGIIVSQKTIDYFPLGIINSHFSLLPEWRGADPITFAILSGQKQTGISLMLLVEAMDEGPLLSQSTYDIPDAMTTPMLTGDLIELSAKSLEAIIPLYLEGKIHAAPQEDVTMARSKIPSYSRKLTKEDGAIDWSKHADQIEREVRAYAEWPKSRTKLGNIDVVIISSKVVDKQIGDPGALLVEAKKLLVACGQKTLQIDSLKPAGKKEMPVEAFLAGYKDKLKLR